MEAENAQSFGLRQQTNSGYKQMLTRSNKYDKILHAQLHNAQRTSVLAFGIE